MASPLTYEQALEKLKHYCDYQPRCHAEVKTKMYALGIWKKEQDQLLTQLIEEGYVDEEAFAIAYARGKNRSLYWGKNKIIYHLKQKQISPYCISKALKLLDDSDYREGLEKLARKKRKLLADKDKAKGSFLLHQYLMQYGYDSEEIKKYIQDCEADI